MIKHDGLQNEDSVYAKVQAFKIDESGAKGTELGSVFDELVVDIASIKGVAFLLVTSLKVDSSHRHLFRAKKMLDVKIVLIDCSYATFCCHDLVGLIFRDVFFNLLSVEPLRAEEPRDPVKGLKRHETLSEVTSKTERVSVTLQNVFRLMNGELKVDGFVTQID